MNDVETMVFVRFYINALFNGSSRELMKQRYPEWDFEISDGVFILKKVPESVEIGEITPDGEKEAVQVKLDVVGSDELQAALAAVDEAKKQVAIPAPLMSVD